MANPLEAWKQHAIASEHMDLTGVGSHQKKGWNFAQNFPALVPGTGVGPAQWVGPTLATGYQLGQEGLRSLLPEKWGGTNIGFVDAMKKGLTEAKQNVQGMGGKGFDKDEYNEWMAAQGYAPDYDFSGIKGQVAMADDDGWTINYPDSPITGIGADKNLHRPDIRKLMQMSRRRQQLQNFKNIEAKTAAEAAKKKVITTTPKGPPSITQKKTKPKVTGPTYGPHKKTKPKVTGPTYGPHKKTKPKVTGPTYGPHGGGGGGGSKKGSPPTGTKGKNPWGRADGGLIRLFKYGGFLG